MIFLLRNPLDSLDCFIQEMSLHHPEFILLDITDTMQTQQLFSHPIPNDSHVITFNNYGLIIRTPDGNNLWEIYHIKIHNIQVDHPIWYRSVFDLHLCNVQFISVDRKHDQFIHHYYPEYVDAVFLPLAGKSVKHNLIPFEKRPIDILVIATIHGSEDEMEDSSANDFIRDNKTLFIQNPRITPEMIVTELQHDMNLSQADELDLLNVLYSHSLRNARNQLRLNTVSYLAKAGCHIEIYGAGWDSLQELHLDNLSVHGPVSATACNELIYQSKFTLNFMPWFKAGSHDRIYDSMLCGSICLTDHSEYLDSKFVDMRDLIYYDYHDLDELVRKIQFLIRTPSIAASIIRTAGNHVVHSTWSDRVESILQQDFDPSHFV